MQDHVVRVGGPKSNHGERQPGQDLAGHEHRAGAEAVDQLGREADREESHHDGHGQEGKPDRHRAVAEHALEVERAEEKEAEEGGRHQALHDVRAGDLAGAEHAKRKDRVASARLAHDERPEERHRDTSKDERAR